MELFLVLSCLLIGVCMGEEPRCPRVDFDKTLLEMLVRLEFKVNQTNDKLAVLEEMVKKETDERKDIDRTTLSTLTENTEGIKAEMKRIDQNNLHLSDVVAANDESRKQNYREIDTRIYEVVQNITVPMVYFLVTNPQEGLIKKRPIFTKVMDNVGDGYDVSSGIFTCRFAGLYQFAFTYLNSEDTKGTTCNIKHNGVTKVQSHGPKRFVSTTLVSFLYLSIGDTVDVICGKGCYFEDTEWMWFSGTIVRTV